MKTIMYCTVSCLYKANKSNYPREGHTDIYGSMHSAPLSKSGQSITSIPSICSTNAHSLQSPLTHPCVILTLQGTQYRPVRLDSICMSTMPYVKYVSMLRLSCSSCHLALSSVSTLSALSFEYIYLRTITNIRSSADFRP